MKVKCKFKVCGKEETKEYTSKGPQFRSRDLRGVRICRQVPVVLTLL